MSSEKKLPPKAPAKKTASNGTRPRDAGREAKEQDMGDALRSVYDRTVQESVPDEFLDLLSKLD